MSAGPPVPPHALAAQVAAWRLLVQALPDPAWVVAIDSLKVVAANDAAGDLLGRPGDALLGARTDHLLATPEDLSYWDAVATGSNEPLLSSTVLVAADGRLVHVRRSIRPLATAQGAPTHCLVTLLDCSAARKAEDRHEETVAELQATLEATADGILVTDLAGGVRSFNRRFAQIWGLPPELLEPRADNAVQEWMRRSVRDPQTYQRRLDALREATLINATERLELTTGQMIERIAQPLWSRGRALGRVYSFRDLTERLQADERIETLARTDALTGLPNRGHMAVQVDEAAQAIRHDGDGFALLLVDLDRFRHVNDSLGHDRGNQVLRDAADRLRGCMRTGDIAARTGGDQFALLLRHANAASAEAAAQRVILAIAQPWECDGLPFTLTCSVGIALCPGHGRSADELLRNAESAVRQAKQAGSNSLRLHQQRPSVDLRSHMQLDHAMRQALASGRFRLHYQPQVEMGSGRILGAEALIRWRDPELGEVPPGRFIPVAEDTGFIIAIGDWVLAQASRQAAQWHRDGLNVTVAVNVSALQFRQPEFVERVADALQSQSLPPDRLELELTESILVRDADEALARLQALAGLGVRLSIDDFGTGYSSLAYLKRFPIDKLKIDRSFVSGLPGGSDAGIVRAIVQMAQALDMDVIAEGVETEPQHRFLREAGCRQYQGYLFAPAMDAISFARRLRAAPPPSAPAERPSAVVHRLSVR